MKHLSFILLFIAAAVYGQAQSQGEQKQLYIPNEWKNPWPADSLLYAESDPDCRYTWSKSRSRESENFILYWDKNYGNTVPTNAPAEYRVDVEDLLNKAEAFYALNVGKLAFCDESKSNVAKYKMMILMNHTTSWICNGAGYDDVIGALWLSPSTCKPVGQSVAHEVGHSFQYQCFADLRGNAGFRTAIGSGAVFWEQTAQWQSLQSYPGLKWDQSWHNFHQAANYATTHERIRYQSYWWHYYLAEKYGIDIIGRLWQHNPASGMDPNEALMDMMGWTAEDLYREYFNYAMKMATIDLDVARDEADARIGSFVYNYVQLPDGSYQVAYSSCPQSTGFNIVPLSVPQAGTDISIDFTSPISSTALASGDPAEYFNGDKFVASGKTKYNATPNGNFRGFRLGFVALMNDGTRQYFSQDSVYCAKGAGKRNCKVSCTVPDGVKRLFFVVSPAPASYIRHLWNENIGDDDQFPYTMSMAGTSLLGAPIINASLPLTDAKITYDVYFPVASDHSGTSVIIEGEALSALGTAMQMHGQQLGSVMTAWNSAGPSDGQAMFYPVNASGSIFNRSSTANGYGHWFNASGTCCDYSNGFVFSEFYPSSLTFSIGQYPNRLVDGRTYTVRQAIKYVRGAQTSTVYFIFRVHPTNTRSGFQLAEIQQDEIISSINPVEGVKQSAPVFYTLSGMRLSGRPTKRDAYIMLHDGKATKIIAGE